MSSQVVARNYASALFDLAVRDGAAEFFGEGLDVVAQLLDEVPSFRRFLEVPGVSRDQKKALLRESFGEKVPTPVLHFLFLVVDRGRQRLLRQIQREYRGLLDEHLGREHVDVTVARALDGEGEISVTEQLSGILGKDVIPHFRVDPKLLGGIVFRSGDVVYDGSVRRRLEQMKRRLIAAEVSNE